MAQAYVVTTQEGGIWQRWRPGRFRAVHTVVFEGGATWDCYTGTRKHPKTPAEMEAIAEALNKVMSPEAALIELKKLGEMSEGDTEAAHAAADKVLCSMLRAFGYDEVVEAFGKVKKWYA